MTEPLGTPFTKLWGATALANMADGVLVVGGPLVALEFTRSPLLVSLTSTLAMAPWLAVPLLAGALADRHDRKVILVVAAGTRTALLAVAAALVANGSFNLVALYVVVLLVGANEVFADTTTQSILPMIVPRERLDAANGRIISAQKVTADLLGAPLAGALAAIGAAALFGTTAIIYAVVAVGLLSLEGRYRASSGMGSTTLVAEIAEGIRFIRSNRVIKALAGLAALLNLAASAYLAVFVLWAVGEESAMGLDPGTYGLLLALVGVGGASGAVVVEPITARFGEVPTLLGSAVIGARLLLVPVAAPTFAAAGPALVAVGIASAATNVVIVSMRQRLIPTPLLGRVNAVYRLVGMGTMPLGALLGGVAAEQVGVRPVLIASSVVTVLAVAAARTHVTSTAVTNAQHAVERADR